MSDDSIKSFLVEIGVKSDGSSAAAAEALIKKTEGKITAITEAETAKRTAIEEKAEAQSSSTLDRRLAARRQAEEKAQAAKVDATAKALGAILGLNEEQSIELAKRTKNSAKQTVDVEKDKAKKLNVVRSEQFKEVEAGLLRFSGFAGSIASGLAGALSAAPFGAFLMGVERTASGLSNMAIQSQRVGTSVAGIQRFMFAMKQQGVDEGEANGALEGFSSKMKTNDAGYRSVLKGWGVKTTDKDGNPLGYAELLENMGPHLASLPYNQARIQFNQMGATGDNALNALRNPSETRKGLAAYDAKLDAFGLDPDKAAEDARKVDQAYNNLEADLKIIHQRLDAEFFVPMVNGFDSIAKKLEQNPQLVENYGRALEAFSALVAARVLPTIANLLVKFSGLQAVLGAGVGAALGIALNPVVVAGASAESTPNAETQAKMDKFNKDNPDAPKTVFGVIGDLWKKHAPTWLGGADGADPQVKSAIIETAESVKKLADATGVAGGSGGGDGGGGLMGRVRRTLGFAATAGGNSPRKGVVGNFGEKGWWTPERQSHAVDVLMKEGGLTEDGAKALVARWHFVESPGGPNAVNPRSGAAGIAQGLGSRKAGYTGPFDDQLRNAARELNSSEGRAKRMLNTKGQEAAGASQFERAEGYNPATGEDNFTARTREGMKHIVHRTASAAVERNPDGTLTLPFRTLGRYIHTTAPMFARHELGHATNEHPGQVAKVEVVKSNLDAAHQKLAETMRSGAARSVPEMKAFQESIARMHKDGTLSRILTSHGAVGISAAMQASIHANRIHNERHGDSFHIHGTDAKSGLDHAVKVSARRGGQDRIRYGQGSVQ